MTWICYRGIELSARIQELLLSAECLILAIFAIVALVNVYSGLPRARSSQRSTGSTRSRSNFDALVDGVLLGIFIYWGWDSGVAVNEESENPAEGPGRAAVLSTILLVLIYLLVSRRRPGRRGHRLPHQKQPERRAEPARHEACSASASCRSCCSSPC